MAFINIFTAKETAKLEETMVVMEVVGKENDLHIKPHPIRAGSRIILCLLSLKLFKNLG